MADPQNPLAQIEADFHELKNQYDLFFQGKRRGEPISERKEFENKLLALSRRKMVKCAEQHSFGNLQSRYYSFANLWARTMRDFEEGRLRRDKSGALTRGGLTSASQESGPARSAPSVHGAAPPANQGHIEQAAKDFLEARKKCGIQTNPSELQSFRNSLESRAKEFAAGGKKVAFHVTVEDGKPKIKARLS